MLSLGAGVQSTALALMAAHGEIEPMPDCAVFADTGREPKAVRDHLAWLMAGNVLPFPVHIVSNGDIRADLLRAGGHPQIRDEPTARRDVLPGGDAVMTERRGTENRGAAPGEEAGAATGSGSGAGGGGAPEDYDSDSAGGGGSDEMPPAKPAPDTGADASSHSSR